MRDERINFKIEKQIFLKLSKPVNKFKSNTNLGFHRGFHKAASAQ